MQHLIHRMGIDRRNLRALPLLPLVEVAWADGQIQPREAELIRERTVVRGLNDDDRMMVEDWLKHSPSPAYLRSGRVALAWIRRHGDPALDPSVLDGVVDEAHAVAAAAGGFLGFGRVCRAERDAIDRLQYDLEHAEPPASPVEPDVHPDFATPNNRVTLAWSNSLTLEGEATLVPMFGGPTRLPVRPRGVLLGSRPDADVQIVDDPHIAADHAVIYAKASGYVVRSIHGPVWVNGERHAERRLLGGETLRLSNDVSFVFKWVRPIP